MPPSPGSQFHFEHSVCGVFPGFILFSVLKSAAAAVDLIGLASVYGAKGVAESEVSIVQPARSAYDGLCC